MSVRIRSYIQDDLNFYLEGEVAAYQLSYPGLTVNDELKSEMRDHVRRSISSKSSIGFTAVTDQPVGFIILSVQYMHDIETGYLENIYVRDSVRQKGYARKLLNHAEDYCRSCGFRILQLDVTVHHPAAIELYESEGFGVASYRMEKNIAQ